MEMIRIQMKKTSRIDSGGAHLQSVQCRVYGEWASVQLD